MGKAVIIRRFPKRDDASFIADFSFLFPKGKVTLYAAGQESTFSGDRSSSASLEAPALTAVSVAKSFPSSANAAASEVRVTHSTSSGSKSLT